MTDFMSKEQRSHAMAKVRGSETKIEQIVRSNLHNKGFRFRKNDAKLPGHPDIVLPKYNAIVLINGCFWHGHKGCRKSKLPTTKKEFWKNKIDRTIERDKGIISSILNLGLRVAVIWECALKNEALIDNSIADLIKWINSTEVKIEIP
jgi:DNA mismatch endonuclease, patch repair protein